MTALAILVRDKTRDLALSNQVFAILAVRSLASAMPTETMAFNRRCKHFSSCETIGTKLLHGYGNIGYELRVGSDDA